jgi:hypothetical protein
MLASYAGDDDRKFTGSREGLIQIPDARGQGPRQRVYMATSLMCHKKAGIAARFLMSAIAEA